MTCSAKRSNGIPCRALAIRGGRVCVVHGGSAPQVKDAAKRRILAAADPAAARLIAIAMDKKTKHVDAITALRDLLTRAGITGQGTEGGADGSLVTFEEFIQIHRRRVEHGVTTPE